MIMIIVMIVIMIVIIIVIIIVVIIVIPSILKHAVPPKVRKGASNMSNECMRIRRRRRRINLDKRKRVTRKADGKLTLLVTHFSLPSSGLRFWAGCLAAPPGLVQNLCDVCIYIYIYIYVYIYIYRLACFRLEGLASRNRCLF